jgi:hypothetical protein
VNGSAYVKTMARQVKRWSVEGLKRTKGGRSEDRGVRE